MGWQSCEKKWRVTRSSRHKSAGSRLMSRFPALILSGFSPATIQPPCITSLCSLCTQPSPGTGIQFVSLLFTARKNVLRVFSHFTNSCETLLHCILLASVHRSPVVTYPPPAESPIPTPQTKQQWISAHIKKAPSGAFTGQRCAVDTVLSGRLTPLSAVKVRILVEPLSHWVYGCLGCVTEKC